MLHSRSAYVSLFFCSVGLQPFCLFSCSKILVSLHSTSDLRGIHAAAEAVRAYFDAKGKSSILETLERHDCSYLIILSKWLPALFLSAGVSQQFMEPFFSLYLCSTSREQAATLILRTAIYLIEMGPLESESGAISTQSIFDWLNGTAHVSDLQATEIYPIDIPEDIKCGYIQKLYRSST